MRRINLFRAALLGALSVGWLSAGLASAADPAILTPDKLVQTVRDAKILKPELPLRVTVSNNQAKVTTLRTAKETDKDCKIDAVLIAKTLMDSFPQEITRVRVVYGSTDNARMDSVNVSIGDVKAYGDGSLSEDALLTSLELSPLNSLPKVVNSGDALTDIKPGPFEDQRTLMMMHIQQLRNAGTDTKPFETIFAQIEASIGNVPAAQIGQRVADLNDKLKEQDLLKRQANEPIIGSGSGRKLWAQHAGGNRGGAVGNGSGAGAQAKLPGPANGTNPAPGTKNSAPPTSTPPANGPLVRAFQSMGNMKKINDKLNLMRASGQDVSSYHKRVKQARELMMNGQGPEGNKMLDEIGREIGL